MAQTEEAQELAERAATQASHAGKNVGRAAKAVAEVATEEVSDVSKNLVGVFVALTLACSWLLLLSLPAEPISLDIFAVGEGGELLVQALRLKIA
jgi:hypothetical protein